MEPLEKLLIDNIYIFNNNSKLKSIIVKDI